MGCAVWQTFSSPCRSGGGTNRRLVAACGSVEDTRRSGLDRLTAAVEYVEDSENDGVAESNSGCE